MLQEDHRGTWFGHPRILNPEDIENITIVRSDLILREIESIFFNNLLETEIDIWVLLSV